MNNEVHALSLPDVETLISEIRRLNLDDNNMLSIYTPEQMAKIYNGVGPDRFSSWFRNMLSEINSDILPAVMIHDLDYDHGGTIEDFYAANERLGSNAIKCINEKYGKFSWRYWFYLAKICIFVKLCNKHGTPGWNFTGETC